MDLALHSTRVHRLVFLGLPSVSYYKPCVSTHGCRCVIAWYLLYAVSPESIQVTDNLLAAYWWIFQGMF